MHHPMENLHPSLQMRIRTKGDGSKVNFLWSTFTWNEVVLRGNVLLRYFHFVEKYFVTF